MVASHLKISSVDFVLLHMLQVLQSRLEYASVYMLNCAGPMALAIIFLAFIFKYCKLKLCLYPVLCGTRLWIRWR